MSSKPGIRTRNTNKRDVSKKGTEPIEVEEPQVSKPQKTAKKQKENIENTSSESTSITNKIKKKKKGKNPETVEMDVEIPEAKTNTERKVIKRGRRKKNENKEKQDDKTKKNEKLSISRKKRRRKMASAASITLEESESDDEDIEITSETKVSRRGHKGKKNEFNLSLKNKKKSKNEKKEDKKEDKKKKEKENTQRKLTEDEGNKYEIPVRLKGKNKNEKKFPNSGFFSSSKISHKSRDESPKDELVKSKSMIKYNHSLKDKSYNLLGRKRRSTVVNKKSATPDNKKEKPKNNKEKSKNQKDPKKDTIKPVPKPKIDEKSDSKSKKNNSLIQEFEDGNLKKKVNSPELTALNKLLKEYGLEKVLDTMCKPKFEERYKLDACLKSLRDSLSLEKLPILLIKVLFTYFGTKIEEIKQITSKRANSSSPKKTHVFNSFGKTDNEMSPKSFSKSPESNSKNDNSSKSSQKEVQSVEIDNNVEMTDVAEEKKAGKEKKNKSQDKNKSNNVVEKKMCIGSHYNRTKEGEIFKYEVSNLDGEGNAVFKCFDDKCKGMAIYEVESNKFSVIQPHNVKNSEHDYIVNFEKEGLDIIMKEFKESKYSDVQIFKKNGEKILKKS